MFKKDNIKDFLDFKTLITESVLKYLFIGLGGLMTLSAVIMIFSGWGAAFQIIKVSFGQFLLLLVGTPILAAIGLAFSLFLLRLSFESVLVRFLTYRELKEINEKTKD